MVIFWKQKDAMLINMIHEMEMLITKKGSYNVENFSAAHLQRLLFAMFASVSVTSWLCSFLAGIARSRGRSEARM
jgi:hypothetical protein